MDNNHPPRLACSLIFLVFLKGVLISEVAMAQNTTISVNVGVVLDLNTLVGKIGLSCIKMALSDFYASHDHYRTRLVLHISDSKEDAVAAAAAALDLIKNVQVQAILGPQSSMQSKFIIHLGDKAHVPIISFSAMSPSLTSTGSSYFIRAAQASSSQVKAIGAIVQAFGWREVVPIYVDNEYGEGIIPSLVDALQEVNARVPYRSVIPLSASDDQIEKELYKLMTMQTRVFILHMFLGPLSSRLISKANEIGMMGGGYVWIMTDGLTNFLPSLDSSVIDSMQGALGVTPFVPPTSELKSFRNRWRRKFQQDYPNITESELTVYGLWAHDATRALAMAVERVDTTNFGFQKIANSSSSNLTDLDNFGISQTGHKLQQVLSSTTFKGLAGDFHLVNMELQPAAFQIVNMAGNAGRSVGFWIPKNGLVREMNPTNASYCTSKSNLKPIIWPGDYTSDPRGWEFPTNGKKLKIGVPVKFGFREFINVTTPADRPTGFCIDVFDAVIKELPYAVEYEYTPYANPDGNSSGTYNELIYQVHLKKYDAVVGDTTILANRSQFVDFTLPFTESGVSMVVPFKDKRQENAWVFLKPLTWDLWITSACLFVFIGFAVWVLEHRINEDFRGPPTYQVGTSFWFSFSTMVFAHRERVVSNLGRFVVIIWAFVVLILTQSYTASLTSMLTVQQLQPKFSDLNELVKNGESVGYLKDSFVVDILKKYKFKESNLKMYKSVEECDLFLSLGSKNGGIAAAVDEIPYMRLFLAKYCSKYSTVEQIYKTDGFGFVFPKGSPLVADVSRAILKVTEGDEMERLEKKWLGKEPSCPDLNSPNSSYSLGLDSFWGLFLIVGVAASLALIIYIATFLNEQRHNFKHAVPEASLLERIGLLFRSFDQKDLTSHTFRTSEVLLVQGSSDHGMDSSIEASPNINYRASQTSLSNSGHPHAYPSPSTQASPEHIISSYSSSEHQHDNPIPSCQASPEHIVSTIILGT